MSKTPNKNQQIDGKTELTARQKKFITILTTTSTFTEACKKGKINRTTLYEWLRQPEFKAEVEQQREQITQEAFGILSGNLTIAVEVLAGLLDDNDKRLKRYAAKDVIDYFIKHKELADIEQRLTVIEHRIDNGRKYERHSTT